MIQFRGVVSIVYSTPSRYTESVDLEWPDREAAQDPQAFSPQEAQAPLTQNLNSTSALLGLLDGTGMRLVFRTCVRISRIKRHCATYTLKGLRA